MAVTIKTLGVEATIENLKWKCDNKLIQKALEVCSLEDVEGYTPFPDLSIAKLAIEKFGGRIIKITDKPEAIIGKVY